jgi:hypothetical protein
VDCRWSASIRPHTSAYVSIRPHTEEVSGRGLSIVCQHTSACVRMRQHTSAYGGGVGPRVVDSLPAYVRIRPHTLACVSIRQHTSACVNMHTSAYVSKIQHTPAYVSIRQQMRLVDKSGRQPRVSVRICTFVLVKRLYLYLCISKASKHTSRRWMRSKAIRQHTSAYVSIRQHTSAYVSIRQRMRLVDAFQGEVCLLYSYNSTCFTRTTVLALLVQRPRTSPRTPTFVL